MSNHLKLPFCKNCQTVQYPPREICCNCLSDELHSQEVNPAGILLSQTSLQHSLEPYFTAHLPWKIGTVQLECGAIIIAHLMNSDLKTGANIELQNIIDPNGCACFIGKKPGSGTVDWNTLEKRNTK